MVTTSSESSWKQTGILANQTSLQTSLSSAIPSHRTRRPQDSQDQDTLISGRAEEESFEKQLSLPFF